MDIETAFERLGLPKHSAAIYVLLEKHGALSASSIVKQGKLHRPAVYKAIEKLLEHTLIAKIGTPTRPLYIAAKRNTVVKLFKETLRGVEKLEKESFIYTQNILGPVYYFKGASGITAIFNDAIVRSKKGETFYRYTSETELDEVNTYLPPHYRKMRDAKKLERLVISNAESGSRKRARLERFIKYLGTKENLFTHNAIQLIYANRVAFIDLNTKESMIIENKTLAEFQKSIFRALYKKL